MTGPRRQNGENIAASYRFSHSHIAWIILFSAVLPMLILAFLPSRSDNKTAEACGTSGIQVLASTTFISPAGPMTTAPYTLSSHHSASATISAGSAMLRFIESLKNLTAGVNIKNEEDVTVSQGSPVYKEKTCSVIIYSPTGIQSATAETKVLLLPSMTQLASDAIIKEYIVED
ncbi:MAG TPA: hypothetical protein PLG59_07760 [bacterium]|nr:hypothetical protein [bacterium]